MDLFVFLIKVVWKLKCEYVEESWLKVRVAEFLVLARYNIQNWGKKIFWLTLKNVNFDDLQ